MSRPAPESILLERFGFPSFRPLQADAIASVLAGRDTLLVLPTGAGKSLCYQIPALVIGGITVVVSPLIALMEDQVERLAARGVGAVVMNGSLSAGDWLRNAEAVRSGAAKLLYTAPESLLKPRLLDLLDGASVSAIAIDEAHCISEWGHDFRPEYRRLAEVRTRYGEAVCVALTATATPRVRDDIVRCLGLNEPAIFVGGFNRRNLFLRVAPRTHPLTQILEFLDARRGQSGIVYCATRRRTEDLAEALESHGHTAVAYHAGLGDALRKRNQKRFLSGQVPIVVATIAFGMGVDKPDVRFVVHHDLPRSIEAYYQEVGRAGRDGLRAECLLLFHEQDALRIRTWLKEKPEQERKVAEQHLQRLLDMATSTSCRRVPILRHFGEDPASQTCGMCDNCASADRRHVDITRLARTLFACVRETGQRFGAHHVVDVLRGSRSRRIGQCGHQRCRAYGHGKEVSRRQWLHVIDQLVGTGHLAVDDRAGLRLTDASRAVIDRGERVHGTLVMGPPTVTQEDAADFDPRLYELLQRRRAELARERSLPPYLIFSNKALVAMAVARPRSLDQLLAIPAVGAARAGKYGEALVSVIDRHCRRTGALSVSRPSRNPGRSEQAARVGSSKAAKKIYCGPNARPFVPSPGRPSD